MGFRGGGAEDLIVLTPQHEPARALSAEMQEALAVVPSIEREKGIVRRLSSSPRVRIHSAFEYEKFGGGS